jgi:ribosome-associated toxin RatA of RatAB toxin-antitoxin module
MKLALAMDTSIERVVAAEPAALYALAAAVEDWPRLLPHYRWVRVLASDGDRSRTVEMAARRDVIGPRLSVPLRWTAVQTLHPESMRIEFRHVRGVTRGMWVEWTIKPAGSSNTEVRIRHVFTPRWPVPDTLVRAIVGEYFVNGVARRTLACLAERAKRPS